MTKTCYKISIGVCLCSHLVSKVSHLVASPLDYNVNTDNVCVAHFCYSAIVSPKRSRRDGKPETERTSSGHNLETADSGGPDQKHRRRLQDALPLEVPVAPVSKSGEDVVNKGFNKKSDGQLNGTNRPSDATEVPRSQSYFQV